MTAKKPRTPAQQIADWKKRFPRKASARRMELLEASDSRPLTPGEMAELKAAHKRVTEWAEAQPGMREHRQKLERKLRRIEKRIGKG
jgi:hypothetical protein